MIKKKKGVSYKEQQKNKTLIGFIQNKGGVKNGKNISRARESQNSNE